MSQIGAIKPGERELVFTLARELTGVNTQQTHRYEILVSNVARRIQATGQDDLQGYLAFVTENDRELGHLISALTIHTTSWFRELPHYRTFERELLDLCNKSAGALIKYRLMSAACSSGEELYSFGIVLETYRRRFSNFEYELVGMDVNPVSVQRAESGIYGLDDLRGIPAVYRRFLVARHKNGHGGAVIDPQIRRRSHFEVGSILAPLTRKFEPFDQVVCRNVLIYFQKIQVDQIIHHLLETLKPSGRLTLGHCEMIDGQAFDLACLGNCTYERNAANAIRSGAESGTILVIDDSPAVRAWLTTLLKDNGYSVVTADAAEAATELLKRTAVDLITLDLNLPGQYGLDWLSDQRRLGLSVPVLVFTDVNAEDAPQVLDALSGPAQDYVNKALVGSHGAELVDRIHSLVRSYRAKSEIRQEAQPAPGSVAPLIRVQLHQPELILIGASTGGTDALSQVLSHMPANSPPVVCVQHIPTEFARPFLERLATVSGLKIGQLNQFGKPMPLLPGHLYLPTQDVHLGIRVQTDRLVAFASNDDRVAGHRPSVDYLFQSASMLKDRKLLACLLTGMGRDGARGLLAMRQAGAVTLAQDEISSVVWGMPGEAVKLGAPVLTGNLRELRTWIHLAIRGGQASVVTRKGAA